MKRLILLTALFGLLSLSAVAQQQQGAIRTIKGYVFNAEGDPLAGAVVNAVADSATTKSGADGTFTIEVTQFVKFLEASYEGYISAQAEIDGTMIIFKLQVDKKYAANKAKAEKAARKAAEAEAAEKAKAAEAARIAAEKEAARLAAEKEAMRLVAEKEAARLAAEREAAILLAKQEAERIAAEKAKAEEEARIAAAKAKAEEEARNAAAKAKAEEEARLAAEKAKAEEEARIAAAKAKAEEEARLAAEKAKAEEEARIAAAKVKAEEEARLATEKAKAAEEARLAAEKALAEEKARMAAEKAQLEEQIRLAVEKAIAAEKARIAAQTNSVAQPAPQQQYAPQPQYVPQQYPQQQYAPQQYAPQQYAPQQYTQQPVQQQPVQQSIQQPVQQPVTIASNNENQAPLEEKAKKEKKELKKNRFGQALEFGYLTTTKDMGNIHKFDAAATLYYALGGSFANNAIFFGVGTGLIWNYSNNNDVDYSEPAQNNGSGYNNYYYYEDIGALQLSYISIPAYIYFKANMAPKAKVSPFISLMGGAEIDPKEKTLDFSYGRQLSNFYQTPIFGRVQLGLNFRLSNRGAMYIGVGYRLDYRWGAYTVGGDPNVYPERHCIHGITANLGFTF